MKFNFFISVRILFFLIYVKQFIDFFQKNNYTIERD